jgi:flagellar motor switch protein FliN/FliY
MADEMDDKLGSDVSETTPKSQRTEDSLEVSPESEPGEPTAKLSVREREALLGETTSGGVVADEARGETSEDPEAKATFTTSHSQTSPPSASVQEQSTDSHEQRPKTASGDALGNRPFAPEMDRSGLDLLYDVELDATLQFGSKEMLLRDVLELGPGDVVELDRHIAEPVDLVVGDRIVARGEVVVAKGNFALRVTEVATPQMRLESIRCLF